jgi:hypothetical protein
MLLFDQWVIEEIRRESNYNRNTTHENLQDTAKADLRGKFVSTYIEKLETHQVNNYAAQNLRRLITNQTQNQ